MPFRRFPGPRWRRHHPFWRFGRWPRVRPYAPVYTNPRPVILDLTDPALAPASESPMVPASRFAAGRILQRRPPHGWAYVPHDQARGPITHEEAAHSYGLPLGRHILRVGDFWETADNGPMERTDSPEWGYYPNENGTYRWLHATELPALPPTLDGFRWKKDGSVWRPFDSRFGAWAIVRREWQLV